MSIAFLGYALMWSTPEKLHEVDTALAPHAMTGEVIEIENEPFVVVGIVHSVVRYSTTRLQIVEPNRIWKLKYKTKRFLRNAWKIITRPLRWLTERRPNG